MPSTATPGTGETTYNPICNTTAEIPLNLNSYRNTIGKDPCQVAGSLLASQECATFGNVTETTRMLRNIIEAQETKAMAPEQKNQCFCTSPVYALVSFCRSCQRSGSFNKSPPVFADWPAWTLPCAIPFSDPQNFIPISTSLLEQERVMKWANDTKVFDEQGTFSLERLKNRVEMEQGKSLDS
ncbi:hypothetical protein L218DRAFT_146127 [Marasmius fiardii PR-910]|nr:hypothetical protein L218DRAFT_146127 [Marasmius fiardii PR-910]